MHSILVAEDDALLREGLVLALEDAGYEVHAAADGHEGRRLAEQTRFDLVIADIYMPGNEDLALLKRLAELPQPPPILVMTGHPSLETAAAAVRLPVVAYLLKPLSEAALLGEVAVALERADALRRGGLATQLARMSRRLDLTQRQSEVLERLVTGRSNKEIASELGCGVRTVEQHVSALFTKAGIRGRTELVATFWRDAK